MLQSNNNALPIERLPFENKKFVGKNHVYATMLSFYNTTLGFAGRVYDEEADKLWGKAVYLMYKSKMQSWWKECTALQFLSKLEEFWKKSKRLETFHIRLKHRVRRLKLRALNYSKWKKTARAKTPREGPWAITCVVGNGI